MQNSPRMHQEVPPFPDFTSSAFLRDHISKIVEFYRRNGMDPDGGFFHCFNDDGTVYDARHRHLVSSTRFVYLFATAASLLGVDEYRHLARHGLAYLEESHFRPGTGGYRWEIDLPGGDGGRRTDDTRYAYGLAFVLLAGSVALSAGIDEGTLAMQRGWSLLEETFWEPEFGLYADQSSPDGTILLPYRGQNANMHICEACIAAYEATGEERYLRRATEVADAMTRRQTRTTEGRIWEHYHPDWTVDGEFHRDRPDDLFRPWGYQPGHHAEWSKLLLQLNAISPREWMVPRARELFAVAVDAGWDDRHGGLYYGFAPDGSITAPDKYYWVQAEAIGAAALLHRETGEEIYGDWYRRLWEYSWNHLVDHVEGEWFRLLDRRGQRKETVKSPPGKAGYHTVGACLTALQGYGGTSTRE
jgi:mannose/cellobiose epimerase-like protein (N-acyl-D-glucosamine 2-epimerase family)